METILVTGGNGRFASELKKIKTKINFIYLDKKELNILNLDSIIKAIKKKLFDLIKILLELKEM